MPSPIAHGALLMAVWPLVDKPVPRPGRAWRRPLLLGAMGLALIAPDFDIPAGLLLDGSAFAHHGGISHSLGMALLFAAAGGPVVALLAGVPVLRTSVWLGVLYASHVVMDALTAGSRGVMMFWPLSDQRVRSPVPLFYGVEHSQPWAWTSHLITLSTELAFVAAVFGVVRWVQHRRRKREAPAAAAIVGDEPSKPTEPSRTTAKAE